MDRRHLRPILLIVLFLQMISFAQGAGFEKTVIWGAQENGAGAAATSSVKGANSLLFNPAGLAHSSKDGKKTEVSLNFSPIFSKFEGPITTNSALDGESGFSPSFGAVGSYQLNEQLGLGFGVYTVGGTNAEYESVDFSKYNASFSAIKPDIKSELSIIEAGLGFGYAFNKNFSLGVGYRASFINAELASAGVTKSSGADVVLLSSNLKDLKDENFASFRVGFQFKTDDNNFGVGLVYRSKFDVDVEGTSSGKFDCTAACAVLNPALNASSSGDLTGGGDIKASTELPEQLALGLHWRAAQDLSLHFEYSWTKYSRIDKIRFSGKALSFGTTDIFANGASDIQLDWDDQHSVKLGVNYTGLPSVRLRGGYVYISQVTNDTHTRATFTPPGAAHTLLAGFGMDLKPDTWQLDVLADYTMASGDGKTTNTKNPAVSGEFKASAFAAHISSKIFF